MKRCLSNVQVQLVERPIRLEYISYSGMHAGMLVETHDAFDSRITPRLVGRFSGTHRIEFVTASPRDPLKYPLLREFPEATARMALDERRDVSSEGKSQPWALLTPNLF